MIYSGNDILGVNMNLFSYDDIDYYGATQEMANFIKDKLPEINGKLEKIGLKCHSVHYYMPKYYNNGVTDDMDMDIKFIGRSNGSGLSKIKYIRFIEENETYINELLAKNVSYDGYIATTVDTVQHEVERIKEGKMPDVIVLYYCLKHTISQDDIDDIICNYLTD